VHTLYGIPNCDSCKKARKWLEANNMPFVFHDVRADGLTEKDLRRWLKSVDWKILLNTRSTTWRNLSEAERDNVDKSNLLKLLTKHPTLVKRPVLESGSLVMIGFSESLYEEQFR